MPKNKKNKKAMPVNVPMAMACVLFCLTLFSTHFASDLYAKYTTSGEADDGARVVKFGNVAISEIVNGEENTNAENTIKLIPYVGAEKRVRIDFTGAETDTFVFVEVIKGNWVKNGRDYTLDGIFSWSVDESWAGVPSMGGEEVAEDVYYIRLEANTPLAEEQKDFIKDGVINIAKIEEAKVPANIAAQLENMPMSFRAIAVQANGFTSPEQAWNSVKN
ncbi:MAG: hypothetical protein IKA10_06090 [Oscillospiraceae bacterium]|nr:hypothetical protein [Oscillospiraceae bacterium]